MSYTNLVSKQSYVIGQLWRQTRTYQGVTTPWDSGSDVSAKLVTVTKSGTSNPLWRSQVKAGNSAGTPYSLTGVRVDEYRPGSVVASYSNGTGSGMVTMTDNVQGFNFPCIDPNSFLSSFTVPDAAALAEVYRKIDLQATQWKGLNFFAEFSDVVRQFGHPFRAIVALTHRHLDRLHTLRRGLTGPVAVRNEKMHKIVADTYLEYAFGLAPLISDAKKAAEALARYEYEGDPTNNPILRARAVGRGSSTAVGLSSFTSVLPFNSKLVCDNIINQGSEARVQYIVGLATAPVADYGSNERLRGLLGFTPEKFIPALWEAVPWSWLVDYFSNVGDVLASVGVDTSSVKWINKTTIMVDTYEVSSRPNFAKTVAQVAAYGYNRLNIVGTQLGSWKVRRTTLVRTVPSTLGWPAIVWSLPIGDEHLGSKLANVSAVLLQRKADLSFR